MSDKVMRYEFCPEWGEGSMEEDVTGDYVKYDDYEDLLEEMKSLQNRWKFVESSLADLVRDM